MPSEAIIEYIGKPFGRKTDTYERYLCFAGVRL